VDGTELETSAVIEKNYDVVIFNFPHVGLGIKAQNDNIEVNQALMKAFLLSAIDVVHDAGIVCLTIKKGEPYDSWKTARIGIALPDLKLKTAVEFNPKDFPGYSHRRTSGYSPEHAADDNEIIKGGAKTYIFGRDTSTGVSKGRGDEEGSKKGGGRKQAKKMRNQTHFAKRGPNPKGSSRGKA
jgi:25S rRNA (uracil2634-N3)-methyltransferase